MGIFGLMMIANLLVAQRDDISLSVRWNLKKDMRYKLGQPKDLDSITDKDILENKVWLWVWEAGVENEYDDDWQVPVIGIENITQDFKEPIISLEIIGSDKIASGSYNSERNAIFGIAIWETGEWKLVRDCSLITPVQFKSMVKINGEEGKVFKLNSKEDDEANAL